MPLRNVITLMITFGTSFFSGPNFLLGTLLSQTSSLLSERQTNIHIHIHMQPVKLQPVHSDFKLRNHEQAHFKSTVCSINSMQHQQYAASTVRSINTRLLLKFINVRWEKIVRIFAEKETRQVEPHYCEWFDKTKTSGFTRRRKMVLQDEDM